MTDSAPPDAASEQPDAPQGTSRRRIVTWAGAGVALLAASLGPRLFNEGSPSTHRTHSTNGTLGLSSTPTTDFSARFAEFEVAEAPNGDLAKVVWPRYVLQAGPEIMDLYAFQVTNGHIMRYMPCFCGCGMSDGHHNNRDCYIQAVNADGSVVFDAMAPT